MYHFLDVQELKNHQIFCSSPDSQAPVKAKGYIHLEFLFLETVVCTVPTKSINSTKSRSHVL
jgi:hypothetical protein